MKPRTINDFMKAAREAKYFGVTEEQLKSWIKTLTRSQ